MNILVIGNSFSLAHGLKTRYKEVLDFCNKKRFKESTNSLNPIKNL